MIKNNNNNNTLIRIPRCKEIAFQILTLLETQEFPPPLESKPYKLEIFILMGSFLGENMQKKLFSNVQMQRL